MGQPKYTERERSFRTGGGRVVRLLEAMRVPGRDVSLAHREGSPVLGPIAESAPGWDAMWDRLVPLENPVKRWPTRRPECRRPV